MNDRDAFEDEMAFLRRLSADDEERLLAGSPLGDGGELEEIAAFTRELPAAVLARPSAATTEALVPRLAEAARRSAATAATVPVDSRRREATPRRRFALAARVAVAVALLPLLLASLAVAGVRLPDPVAEPFDSVGIELPNQDEAGSGSGAAKEADEADGTGSRAGTKQDKPVEGGNAAGEGKQGKPEQAGGHGKPAKQPGAANGVANGKGKAKARGKRGTAPGQTKTKPHKGEGGKGKATGRTEATPPGQAKPKQQQPKNSKE